jgi:hypothetical protein
MVGSISIAERSTNGSYLALVSQPRRPRHPWARARHPDHKPDRRQGSGFESIQEVDFVDVYGGCSVFCEIDNPSGCAAFG